MVSLRSTLLVLPILAAAAALAGPTVAQTPDPRGVDPASPNPLLGTVWYVDQQSPSMQQYRALKRRGQDGKAALIWKIAREPKNIWVGRFTRPNFHVKVRRIIDAAKAQGAMALLTVLRAQSTKCSPTYAGGGPAEDARTRNWYDALARAIGNDRVLIAFEPDSLGTIDCLAPSRRDDRYKLLRYGVDALSQLPNATVYIEAGASDWEPAKRMARKLRAVGVAKVRGFMLNATHYDWTAANIEYGLEISRRIGSKHFVINTAENGRGPVHRRLPNGRRQTVWCNPPNRGLGPPPTTETSRPDVVDAYLWINRPGYAQSCQGRKIGWYLPRALEYARNATDWERPPGR